VTSAYEASSATVERATESARLEPDVAIASFVVEDYDRLLGLARLICRDTSDAGPLTWPPHVAPDPTRKATSLPSGPDGST
jgi:hypothetical protein